MTQNRKIFHAVPTIALLALAGCTHQVPNSAQGVGFDNYDGYTQRREAVLEGRAPASVIAAPPTVTGAPLTGISPQDQARLANSGVAPLNASPSNPAPAIVENAAGISGENDFNAVSSSRTIESDAALIAQNRAQYQVIQPEALPTRPGTNTPNIVAYALQTTNPKGVSLYRRGGFASESRTQRNCAGFASADLAQEAFLAEGGPEKDRNKLDPDGDGFACGWDPAPFRAVHN
ncbi:hypothetical protein [Marivita sp. S2033]|uniref:hypothetical protein n=1 Tax=Marivita sp. S2033 TaxID=3373187 RepID=UPI0039825255